MAHSYVMLVLHIVFMSESQIAAVRKYIQTQEQHHAHRTSHEELVALLRKHRVEFNEEDLRD